MLVITRIDTVESFSIQTSKSSTFLDYPYLVNVIISKTNFDGKSGQCAPKISLISKSRLKITCPCVLKQFIWRYVSSNFSFSCTTTCKRLPRLEWAIRRRGRNVRFAARLFTTDPLGTGTWGFTRVRNTGWSTLVGSQSQFCLPTHLQVRNRIRAASADVASGPITTRSATRRSVRTGTRAPSSTSSRTTPRPPRTARPPLRTSFTARRTRRRSTRCKIENNGGSSHLNPHREAYKSRQYQIKN